MRNDCYESAHVYLSVLTSCIALFISFLCAKGLAPATINSYLSPLAYDHKIHGHFNRKVTCSSRTAQSGWLPLANLLSILMRTCSGSRSYQYICLSAFPLWVHAHDSILRLLYIRRIGMQKKKTQSYVVVQFHQVTFLKQTHHMTAVKIVITSFKHNTYNRPFTILIENKPSVLFCPM